MPVEKQHDHWGHFAFPSIHFPGCSEENYSSEALCYCAEHKTRHVCRTHVIMIRIHTHTHTQYSNDTGLPMGELPDSLR